MVTAIRKVLQPSGSALNHIPGLDGLRALAALGVIGYHLHLFNTRFTFIAVGWTGVDLFFVLSGFLITTILLVDKDNHDYYVTFYSRRGLRIFPIYYFTLFVLFIWAIATKRSVSEWPYLATYTQNWLNTLHTPAENLTGELTLSSAAAHTWSLAIEEQFYLLWPIAVRKLPTNFLKILTIILILLGPLSRYFAITITGRVWPAYGPLFCQVDMLAWGALGAIIYFDKSFGRAKIEFVAKCGLTLGVIIIGVIALRHGFAVLQTADFLYFAWGQVVYSSIGPMYLFLLIVAMAGNALTTALELRPMRYCGRISYGLYLYHFPVYIWITGDELINVVEWKNRIFVIAITFVISAASYHWIERPILKAKDRFFPRSFPNNLDDRIIVTGTDPKLKFLGAEDSCASAYPCRVSAPTQR